MQFRDIYDAGFTELISIIPPGATLSAQSKLRPESLGKVPGRRNSEGTWGGYDWMRSSATAEDVAEWQTDGAGLGLKTGRVVALDIDVMNDVLATEVESRAVEQLGWAPVRYGNHPKRLLVYRTDKPMVRQRIIMEREHESALVEVLGEGQQFIVAGTHPKTKKPYTWDMELDTVGFDGLTIVTADQIHTFLRGLELWLTNSGFTGHAETGASGHRAEVDQDSLRGDPELVRAAVESIPNTNVLFPHRDDYIKMGVAIKAALGEEGYDVFALWAGKWDGGTNAVIREDWGRIKPPYAVGASWLYELARLHGVDPTVRADFDVELGGREEIPVDAFSTGEAIPYSDAWLAARLRHFKGENLRYSSALGGWLLYDNGKWHKDERNVASHLAAQSNRSAGTQALTNIDNRRDAEGTARRCASSATVGTTLAYLSSDPLIAVVPTDFDTDPWLLNTPSGIVNLKTGVVRAGEPKDLMMRSTAVTPEPGRPEKWLKFLDEATGGDAELVAYLQRLAGYSLTGVTHEHTLAFLYGSGGNGKGVFLNTLVRLLGSYAAVAAMDTFTASKSDRHSTDLAGLAGARLVTAQETQEGRSWDEAKIKSITGGDSISARFMRQDFFTYTPQFKLVFAGNHRPRIQNLDEGLRRRFHLVPFTLRPVRPNLVLQDELFVEEGRRILQWAIDGTVQWQAVGLNPPVAVVNATAQYFDDENPVGRWMNERTKFGGSSGSPLEHVFGDWREWAVGRGETPGNERSFLATLSTQGFKLKRLPGSPTRFVVGLTLRGDATGFIPLSPVDLGEQPEIH